MKRLILILLAIACVQHVVGQRPDSNFGGVQVGATTYSFRSMENQSLEAVLDYCVKSGINSVELLSAVVEGYAGAPRNDRESLRRWRESVSMNKIKEIRKIFKKRGVDIHLLGFDYSEGLSDGELNYAFNVCKALGAKGFNTEINEDAARRLAPFTEIHKLYVTFHNHGQPGDPNFSFDRVLSYGPRFMLNFDAGHYYGATGLDPSDLVMRLHERIFSIHLKDKTGPRDDPKDTNQVFGRGRTPLVEMLRLIARERWHIYCDIELEYRIPDDSDAVREVAKSVEYCRVALEE